MYSGQVKVFHNHGAVTCIYETDPKHYKTIDGRWIFDPRNKNYEKAFHLAFPQLVNGRAAVNLGNVIESVLGVRERAIKQRHPLAYDVSVISVCSHFSEFVNCVYNLTQYTKSEYDPCTEWVSLVDS